MRLCSWERNGPFLLFMLIMIADPDRVQATDGKRKCCIIKIPFGKSFCVHGIFYLILISSICIQMKNPIHWLAKKSNVLERTQFTGEIVMVVCVPMMNVVSFAIQIGTPRDKSILRTHASFTPFGNLVIVKHIQNVLPKLRKILKSVCGNKMMS